MNVDNLASAFDHQASRTPGRLAMRWDTGQRTYEQLREAMARRAGVLKWIGLQPGDRVALALPNGPDYLEIVLAVAQAGMVLVPLDPRLTQVELERRLVHAGCRTLIWVRGVRRMLERDAAPRETVAAPPDSVAAPLGSVAVPDSAAPLNAGAASAWAIVYTSGSTGEPKGATLSHLAKLHSVTVEAREYGTGDDSVVLVNTPLFHVHALVHAFTALLHGGCVTVARRFDPAETLRAIDEHRVTEISMVPTMYSDLLAANPDPATFARLRVARCTGAALPDDLREVLLDRFGHCLHVLYGATEAGGITNLRPADVARKPGSVGRPFDGVEIEIRDGLVHVRSAAQFSGYHRGTLHRPGEDWLTLNDLGRIDDEGFLFLEGRADDVIISGGESIQPAEVEAVLREHPAVVDVAVAGLQDARLGQIVAAFVVQRAGQALDFDPYLDGRLARFKRPRRIIVVNAIPRNAMGKADRAALQRLSSSH